jgi:nucleoid DNA-binding protein
VPPLGDPTVTKKEIVKKISEDIGLTQLKTKDIVQRTLDAIIQTLVSEGRIELRNFGVFEVKRRAPRKARNPRTGDKVYVPAKNVVTFKPGKEMEELVRKMNPEKLPLLESGSDADELSDGPIESDDSSRATAPAKIDLAE